MRRLERWMRDATTLECIPCTSIVPRTWDDWFWSLISDSAPFSWGDNNRSIVTAERFARHAESCMSSDPDLCEYKGTLKRAYRNWLDDVRKLGDTYIDLEN